MISGRWLRMAPEDSSMPLQTMSYWKALMVSGSWFSSASSPPWGMENGLWLKSICLASSSYSYIGKSTIQQNLNASASISPRSWPSLVRTVPANLAASSLLAGGEEHGVAGLAAPQAARIASAPLGVEVLGDRPLGAVGLGEGDVAEAAGALLPRPVVQLVEEAARVAAGARGAEWRARRRRLRRSWRTGRSRSRGRLRSRRK